MNKNNTTLTYKLNNVIYRKVFSGRVSYPTIERFMIMEKHIGLSKIRSAIASIENSV